MGRPKNCTIDLSQRPRIVQNNNYILAIELLCAAQAIDIAGHYDQLSPVGKLTYKSVRSQVPTLNEDRYMSDNINRISNFLPKGELLNNILNIGIEIR